MFLIKMSPGWGRASAQDLEGGMSWQQRDQRSTMLNFSHFDFSFLINATEEASVSHLPAVGEALCSLARISLSERGERNHNEQTNPNLIR